VDRFRRSMDGGGVDDPAVVMAITIIGLPWTRAAFNIAVYTLLPFGQKAVSRATYGQHDLGTGPFGILGNVLWLVLAGWWLALATSLPRSCWLAPSNSGMPDGYMLLDWAKARRNAATKLGNAIPARRVIGSWVTRFPQRPRKPDELVAIRSQGGR
jgi:hypothetical protein